LAASHNYANPTHLQEKDLERKTNAIYGRKCLDAFERLNHVGLWAKTFSALLIGMEGWYSKRCRLIWKLKGTKSNRMSGGTKSNGSKNNDEQKLWGEQAELNTRSHELLQDASNTNCERYSGSTSNGIQKMEGIAAQQYAISTRSHKRTDWLDFPTVSPICNGDDGISDRLDSITFPKWRRESIKAAGNAVVVPVVHQIFKAIHTFETQNLKP